MKEKQVSSACLGSKQMCVGREWASEPPGDVGKGAHSERRSGFSKVSNRLEGSGSLGQWRRLSRLPRRALNLAGPGRVV